MNYGSSLPLTGGGFALGAGYMLGISNLILIAVTLVVGGILLYRYGSRRRRHGARAGV